MRAAVRRVMIGSVFVLALGLVFACAGEAETPTTAMSIAPTTAAPAASTTAASAAPTTTGATTSPSTTEASGALTAGTTEGPYYISDTREVADGDLNYAGLPGEPIKISGYVYGGTGNSAPLAGAKIEIWQTDADGQYYPAEGGDAADFDAAQLALRGYVLTDADGGYQFTSIYPGVYPGRCRHIHVRASAAGYGSIVSQLIVPARPGDGQTPETDQIARSLPPTNHLAFVTQDGVQQATFDFHLGSD